MRITSRISVWVATIALAAAPARAQSLSVHWDELTGPDFIKAIEKAQGVCVLPFGIMEKHGPHLPLGNDLINVRYVAIHAAEEEYAVVFPAYYFGQIFEAKHQPGTVAYSARMQMDLLQETTDEMGRNGCKKIMILNGHGGNESLLPFFAQAQLASPHDYVVYIYRANAEGPGRPAVKDTLNMHAGQTETSHTMIAAPDLVHLDRATEQSGADQHRLNLPREMYTGIWWYARFPNHYSGEGALATRELGEFDMKASVEDVAKALRAIKADDESLKLQKEFYEKSGHPLDTAQ